MPRGKKPGPSIKNPKQYEDLKQKGFSKSSAAAISNASYAKGHKKSAAQRPRARKKRGG